MQMKLGQKNIFTIAFLFVIVFGVASAQTISLSDPKSQSDGTILISWTVDSETGIDHYEIYRSTSNVGQFVKIGDQKCGVFEFKDTGLFKTTIKYFCYKVIAIATDQSVRSQSAIVGTLYNDGTSSTAKRTWGSIKAMFR
jgi:fibronectin type 3 domain-containing protein